MTMGWIDIIIEVEEERLISVHASVLSRQLKLWIMSQLWTIGKNTKYWNICLKFFYELSG